MKNKRILLLAAVACTMMATSCHKTCTCIGYDSREHTYTAEEVEQLADGNCSDMIIQANIRYYSVCNWD